MRLAFLAPLTLAAAIAACSDSTAPPIPLTDEEVGLLLSEMSSIAAGVPITPAIRADAMPSLSSTTVSTTVDCVRGGTATLNGTANETLTGATLAVTASFANCGSEHFTVGGLLRINAVTSQPNDSSFTLQATVKGTLNVTHVDGRAGSCRVDVTASFASNGADVSAMTTGTVCGRDADAVAATSG